METEIWHNEKFQSNNPSIYSPLARCSIGRRVGTALTVDIMLAHLLQRYTNKFFNNCSKVVQLILKFFDKFKVIQLFIILSIDP